MNCQQVRDALPEFLYGGLTPDAAARIDAHLNDCPACRRDAEGLRCVRRLLAAAPAPEPRVDAPALCRKAAELQARRLRFWRRAAAAAVLVTAASLGLALVPRLEVRLSGQELAVRWGRPEAPPAPPPPADPSPRADPTPPKGDSSPSPASEERMRVLSELVQALAEDGRKRDYDHAQEVARLRDQLHELERQSARRCAATERDVEALYATQFKSQKGEKP
jgi:hypothetical protein